MSEDAEAEKQVEEQAQELKPKTQNRTSVMLSRSHDDSNGQAECSYCGGKRDTFSGSEQGLKYYKLGLTCTKLRSDDYQYLMQAGFTRCGTYVYSRNLVKSCCECYQYKVDAPQFKANAKQKTILRRFHRYLATGKTQAKPEASKAKVKKPIKNDPRLAELLKKYTCIVESAVESLHEGVTRPLPNHRVIYDKKKFCFSSNVLFQRELTETEKEGLITLLTSMCECNVTGKYINFSNEWRPQELCMQQQEGASADVNSLLPNLSSAKQIAGVDFSEDPNHYAKYIDPILPQEELGPQQIRYTIHIHRAMFTDELYQLYKRYELAVHGKEREADQLKRFLCNSPVYDPTNEEVFAESMAELSGSKLDAQRHTFCDQGVIPPCHGSYHMYHRLDGKLVAVGVIDILDEYLNSAYFIYDPDYKFLNLGVVGALRELEYMAMLRRTHNQKLRWYQLGELCITCPKVNYKAQYQPGWILCPRTKQEIAYESVLDRMKLQTQVPLSEKIQQTFVQLDDTHEADQPTSAEIIFELISPNLGEVPILYESVRWINVKMLTEKGQEILGAMLKTVLSYAGLDFLQRAVFELKFAAKNQHDSEDEDEKESRLKSASKRFQERVPYCSQQSRMRLQEAAAQAENQQKCEVCEKQIAEETSSVWKCACEQSQCKPYCALCVDTILEKLAAEANEGKAAEESKNEPECSQRQN